MTLWANGSMHCAASARPPPRTFAGHAAAAWIRGIRRPVAARAIDPTLEGLRSALDQAVATEDYASAARLRDAILVADPEAHATALIAELRDRLGEAVAGERFLEAAELRDRLLRVQLELQQLLADQPPPLVWGQREVEQPQLTGFARPPASLLRPPPSTTSDTLTNGIRVVVQSFFVPREPNAAHGGQYHFEYRVRITNEGSDTVRLKSRYWRIVDGEMFTQEVRGPGVAGERPVLEPGQSFEYTAACPLRTPVGCVEGHFEMVTRNGEGAWGEPFPAIIGRFGLTTEARRVEK